MPSAPPTTADAAPEEPVPHGLRIRSGGQTGVDRAALDAAIAAGLDIAGWVPKGGWAEDMPDPPGLLARYPALKETVAAEPAARTAANIRDGAGTLVLLPTADFSASPGTALTMESARAQGKPHCVVALDDRASAKAARDFIRMLRAGGPARPAPMVDLNIAGPRESEASGVYAAAYVFLKEVFDGLK